MHKTGTITMSMQELDRLKVIQAVIDGHLKLGRAAERLQLTVRQIQRLIQLFKSEGAAGLISRRYGRPSNNRGPIHITQLALEIIQARYADFGPTLACEKLHECHGLTSG
jgi:hypothetical protein